MSAAAASAQWVALLPTKMGGGTYALDLQHEPGAGLDLVLELRRLQPDLAPPLRLPQRRSLSLLRIRQQHAGRQELPDLWHPDEHHRTRPGFNIYRVRYDGAQMELMENVSETTGLGLGVHVTVNPQDAQCYFVTDGQKDIAACFDRTTSRVMAALKFDWAGNSHRSRAIAGRMAAR